MTKELSESEYLKTMAGGMVDISSHEAIIDIWPYVKELTEAGIVTDQVFHKQLVEMVYRNAANTFHHVLLPTNNEKIMIVVIIDAGKRKMHGHFVLDLNKQYGA